MHFEGFTIDKLEYWLLFSKLAVSSRTFVMMEVFYTVLFNKCRPYPLTVTLDLSVASVTRGLVFVFISFSLI